jgi:hypothetical protein
MLAEIEQIATRREQRRFAWGCLRALALTVPVIVGGCALAGVLSVAVVVTALVRYPGLVTGPGTWLAIGSFVAVVFGYVAAAAGLATRLASHTSTAAIVISGAAIAGSWMSVGLAASEPSAAASGMATALLVLAPAVSLGLGLRATRRWSSPVVGMQSVGLAALVSGLILFLLWAGQTVLLAGRPYDAGLVRDFRASTAPDLATYAVSDNLGSGMMLLLLVPLVSLGAGAVGTTVAARWPRADA